jgi:hypothetical protein
MDIIPLTFEQVKKYKHIRKKVKCKQKLCQDWINSIRYTIIEGVQKRKKENEES